MPTDLPSLPPVNTPAGSGLVSVESSPQTGAGPNGQLVVVTPPSSQTVEAGREAAVQLPQGIFRNTDTSARTTVEASLADGRPLPDWLRFDPNTGRFSGKPPTGAASSLDIRVQARDDRGNSASTQFALRVADNNQSGTTSNQASNNPAQPAGALNPPVSVSNPGAQRQESSTGDNATPRPSTNPTSNPTPATASGRGTGGTESSSSANLLTASSSALISTDGAGRTGGGREGLFLIATPAEQAVTAGREASFQLPAGMFRHSNSDAKISIEAKRVDGQPLPDWLRFDPSTGRFQGLPPGNSEGVIAIRVIARDENGQEVTAEFRLRIGQENKEGKESQAQRPNGEQAPTPTDREAALEEDLQEEAGKSPQRFAESLPSAQPRGRISLSEQFARHGRQGMDREKLELQRQLQRFAVSKMTRMQG